MTGTPASTTPISRCCPSSRRPSTAKATPWCVSIQRPAFMTSAYRLAMIVLSDRLLSAMELRSVSHAWAISGVISIFVVLLGIGRSYSCFILGPLGFF